MVGRCIGEIEIARWQIKREREREKGESNKRDRGCGGNAVEMDN